MGVWTALEQVNENNGCLFVLPGTHKGPVYPHVDSSVSSWIFLLLDESTYCYFQKIKNAIFHEVQGFEGAEKVNLIMERGDTVFFHPTILHGAGPNLSKVNNYSTIKKLLHVFKLFDAEKNINLCITEHIQCFFCSYLHSSTWILNYCTMYFLFSLLWISIYIS